MSMMYNNGNIVLNRGDSFQFAVQLNLGTKLAPAMYELRESDAVYMGIMEPNQPFETALIRKKFTVADLDENGNVIIKLKPRDTQCVLPGKYFYQIKLSVNNNEDVYTVVDKTQFFITE